MKITVVIPDKTVVVDGVGYTVAMPSVAEAEALYSIVWDGEQGEADRNNGTAPVKLTREDYGRLVYPYYLAWQNAKGAADKEAEIAEEASWAMYNSPEALWHRLRKERNKRLAETDYVFAPDYPALTSESLGAVKSYRQALRDLPSQPGAPWTDETVPWPDKPAVAKEG